MLLVVTAGPDAVSWVRYYYHNSCYESPWPACRATVLLLLLCLGCGLARFGAATAAAGL